MSIKVQIGSLANAKDCARTLAAFGTLGRELGQVTLFALRAGPAASKFLLAIYTAHYLSLSDLGIYGLLVGGTTMVPGICGLGLTGWIVRRLVDLPLSEAVPLVASRFVLSASIQLVGQPLVLLGFILSGRSMPIGIVLLCGAILLLETLALEMSDVLMARRRVMLANSLMFLRQGFWPLGVVALGLLVPSTRSLQTLLTIWCAVLLLTWLILLWLLLQNGRWRYVRLHSGFLRVAWRDSYLLYIDNVSNTISSFGDRFLISILLGLDLTGVYSLFWAIANIVHTLVVGAVLQPHVAPLVAAAKDRTGEEFRALERQLQVEALRWALVFAGAVSVLTPVLVSLLDRPLIGQHMPVFWLMVAATLLRIASDGYALAVYAFHRDRAIALIGVCGALGSAAANLVLVPLAGLWGSAFAYVLISAAFLIARVAVYRSAARSVRADSQLAPTR